MKVASILCLSALWLVPGLLGGCASSSSGSSAAADAAPQKKGHWITLPPQTGSYIPRRVWVDEGGQTAASPSANNVQSGSTAAFERMQQNSSGSRPPGS